MVQRGIQRVIVGSALVIATSALLPIAKEVLRPVARDLSRQMKFLLVSAKEGIEDVVAEVKFERMKAQLDKDMFIDCEVEIVERNEAMFR
ncbi:MULTISPECIES: DUF5132 domain-containing protein [Bacillaceae]|jgi:hypothetical protein|uniref:DUF5132 domain-containing protein n=1 Tax=Ectobacillus funiculus TaxID=137993 RepID=A0ABV5WFU5_9BACI|nr:DUF5132 domain-containing protein [Ectobacillus funiculus]